MAPPRGIVRRPGWALAAIVLATALLASAAAYTIARAGNENRLELLRELQPLPYHLGDSFDGLPLTHVGAIDDGWRVEVGYGKCRRRGSRLNPYDEDRCDYPVFVQTTRENLALMKANGLPYPSFYPGDGCIRAEVLGVPAALTDRGVYDGLNVFTGRVRISVMAERSRLLPAARMLRTANDDQPRRLAEPAAGVRERVRRCKVDASAFEPVETALAALRRSDPELPFLGLEYEGARLDRIRREGRTLIFLYEGCGTSSSSILPLTCTIVAAPYVYPPPATRAGALSCESTDVSGVPGVFVEYEVSSTRMRELVLFTDRYVVRIGEGDLDHDPLLRRARALRPLAHGVEPAGRLAPPASTNPPVVRGCPKR